MLIQKKSIALVCLARCLGGLELDTLKTARLLSNKIVLVVVVAKHSDLSRYKDEIISLGHIYQEVDFRYHTSFSLAWQFRKILKLYQISHILFFGSSEIKSLYFSCIGLNVHFIMRHGTTRGYKKDDWLHRWLYQIITIHFTISDHLKKNVLEMVPVAKNSRVVRVYRSVEFPHIITRQKKTTTLRLLNLARIDPGKGQLETLQAVLELKKRHIPFKLQFVGSITKGNYFEKIQSFVSQHQLQDDVEFLGHQEDISFYLMQADIFIFPSWGEGLPNVILEGFAHALPIIAFENTVFPEFRSLGFHLHLAAHKNVADLADKLLYVAHHLEEEFMKALENRNLAQRIFSKDQEIAGILEMLE